jgi:hypothetical protein
MCQLVAQAKADINAQSLAAIRPARVDGIEFSAHPGWTPEQLGRFDEYRNQGDLFRETPPRLLDPPRLVVQLSYHCETEDCNGHIQRIIDWELTALQLRYRGQSDSELKSAITNNFLAIPFGPGRAPMISSSATRRTSPAALHSPSRALLPEAGGPPPDGDFVLELNQ